MDLRESFITIRKNELSKLENQIAKLIHEKEKLHVLNEILASENRQLKKLIPQTHVKVSDSIPSSEKIQNHNSTVDFVRSQGYANSTSNICQLPSSTAITAGDYGIGLKNSESTDNCSNQGLLKTEPLEASPIIGYETKRKLKEGFSENKSVNRQELVTENKDIQIKTNSVLDFPNYPKADGFKSLNNKIKNKDNPSILLKVMLSEWTRKPNNMTRMEFFYHVIAIFIENGVFVNYCTEHQPPCRPRVDCKKFEQNASVLKQFIESINRYKQLFIGVELLVALENFIYFQPKYRPAISDILDILYRKGVTEAAAFGEWSEIDIESREQKKQLVREIKTAGFSLIKRSSSL